MTAKDILEMIAALLDLPQYEGPDPADNFDRRYKKWVEDQNRKFHENMRKEAERLGVKPPPRPRTKRAVKPKKTWRTVLGLSEHGAFTDAQVKTAFRRALFDAHPDHGGSTAETMRVMKARDQARRDGFFV